MGEAYPMSYVLARQELVSKEIGTFERDMSLPLLIQYLALCPQGHQQTRSL